MSISDKLSEWSPAIDNYMKVITISDNITKAYQYHMAFGAKSTTYNDTTYSGTKWFGDRITEARLYPNDTGMRTIGYQNAFSYAFEGCANLTTVSFPEYALKFNPGSYAFRGAFMGCSKLTSVSKIKVNTFGNSTLVFQDAFYGCNRLQNLEMELPATWESSNQYFQTMLRSCPALKTIKISGLKTLSKDGTVHYFGGGTYNWLYNYQGALDEIELTDLETITNTNANGTGVLSLTPQGQTASTAVKTLKFPKLTSLNVLDGESTNYFSTFIGSLQTGSTQWCYTQDIYLPVCTYVGYNAFNMLNGTRVHFAAANQSTIEALPGYQRHFLTYGNCTILFDL